MAIKSKDIILYINNPAKRAVSETLSNENQLIPRYNPRKIIYPPRRSSNFMRFYDMGLKIIDGVETDNLFSSPADTTINGFIVTENDYIEDVRLAARNAALLAVDIDDFEATYPQILRDTATEWALDLTIGNGGSAYRQVIIYNNPRWKNDQLDFTDLPLNQRFRIIGGPFFAQTDLGGTFVNKITTSPTFASGDVSSTFVLRKDAKIFLAPAYCNTYHDTRRTAENVPPYVTQIINETLYVDYQTYPRIFFRDNTLVLLYGSERFNFAQQRYVGEFDGGKYNIFRQSAEYLRNQTNAIMHYKEYRSEFFEGNFVGEANIFEPRDGSLFPADPPFTLPDPNGLEVAEPGGNWFSYQAQWSTRTQSGALLAVVKQGGNAYYVWER